MTAALSPLTGRDVELRTIGRVLAASTGAGHALGIFGEPGIGKSRLLGELAARAEAAGMLVLGGRAAELERDLPFGLIADALDHPAVAAFARGDGADLAPGLPLSADPAGGAGERQSVARAVRALLERLAADRPVALVLDDAHWADAASEDVLSLLLHRPPRGPVLLALTARTARAPALETAMATAARHGAADLIDVGPIGPEDVAAILPGVSRAIRDRLYRESGGNPFYLEELARTADLGPVDRQRPIVGVPPAVRAALAAEARALPGPARLALEAAAVAGDPFDPEVVAAVAGVEEPAVLEALDALLDADLVRPTDRPRRFRFRHPLVRRSVYEDTAAGWRLAAHARAADALAARGASAAQRAHHVERAARMGDEGMAELLVRAAREVAPAAPATAAGWLAAALRLLPETPETAPRRLALMGEQAHALASAGRVVDARDTLRRVLAMLPPEATAERVQVVVALTDLEALWTDQPDAASRMLRAERAALPAVAPGLRAALTLAMARERAEHGDRPAAQVLAEEARELARAAGDRALEADAAVAVADAAHCRLRRDDPRALAEVDHRIAEAGALVEGLGDEAVAPRLQMLLWLGVARLFTGRFPAGHAAADRGLRVARQTRQGVLAPAFLLLRSFADEEMGRLDDAEAGAEEALDSALISGNAQVAFFASAVLSWCSLARGRVDDATRHGIAIWEHNEPSVYGQAGYSLADARLAAGDPEGALDALDTYGWIRPEMWTLDRVKGLEVIVRVLLALGRVDEAADWAGRAPAEGGGRRTGVFGALAASAGGHVLLARGDAAAAARVALQGAIDAQDGRAPIWSARCRALAGRALIRTGEADAARVELRRAAAELEACGAWGHRDAALQELRRLGGRPKAPAATPAPGDAGGPLSALTPREREVAALMADGDTNAQIALRLRLSERTVEKHASRVLAKLGVPTRAGVVRLLAAGEEAPGRWAVPALPGR